MNPCPQCGTANRAEAKFCGECGTALGAACPSCGKPYEAGQKFCDECGAALQAGASAPPGASTRGEPAAERRLVSVLFADLVGFTSLSESRDAEEVRELLSRYFDTSRRLIELYGGTVEKFIGDAVMAVWGTPTATEDDAERAVRAALDLVTAVSALGEEFGAAELRLRAGVLTGEAAVTLGAEGEGMVAGDLVNTAARIQSAAEPGQVLVGEATRRASEQSVVYEDGGSHELKGKTDAVSLYRALRVASGRRGALKSTGLEAPFVGRDRELRLVKELFHASADERTAHLISVVGVAGIGKSRLGWEFYKYFDGLAESVYWHRGRCLAYGEGVTYWALADMVRMRARIAEDEDPASARAKLAATLSEHVLDSDERRVIEPRLAHLLGVAETESSFERHDLFGAWRLFFERLADSYPVVLVFEDVQWADSSLLDFVEYLLEWSRSSPLTVLTLARPELLERRPNWGAGSRNFTSLHLDPLSDEAMGRLLDGYVPGLPDELRSQILARAEGVPLYAVETVRMLLDRGLLEQAGSVYRPTGEIEALDVPETLHGLVASRLDGLPTEERRLLQDASVVGKTFAASAVAAVAELPEADADALLTSLVRKEVLGLQTDPSSPEHGQYGFLQDLVRHVAYETLSKRERRARHLATAAYLESAFPGEDEIAEVIAAHYLDAYEAAPDAEDAEDVREKARQTLVRAGDRADSLGAPEEALRYLERAGRLADDPLERARLLHRAGWLGIYAADFDQAESLLQESLELYESAGEKRRAARVAGRLAFVERALGKNDEAIARAENAYAVLAGDEPSEELAFAAVTLGSTYFFTGKLERAEELVERAIEVAESVGSSEMICAAFTSKAIVVANTRPQVAIALLRQALALAIEHGHEERAYFCHFNLSDLYFQRDRYEDALEALDGAIAGARRRGLRPGEWSVRSEMTYPLYMLGRWDKALETFAPVPEERLSEATSESFLTSLVPIRIHRGDVDEAVRLLSLLAEAEGAADLQQRAIYLSGAAAVARAQGELEEAVAAGGEAAELARVHVGEASQAVKQGLVEAIEAAVALGEDDRAEGLIASIEAVPPGLRSPYLGAQATRFRARLDAEPDAAADGFAEAAAGFRELKIPFWLAVTLLEHGELLAEKGDAEGAAPLLAEARELFDELGAVPWLERVAAASGEPQPSAVS